MPKLTFISADGEARQTVDAPEGITLMEAARNAGIESVAGDCGGACICGTCHIYVDPAWWAMVGEPIDIEQATMEFSENVMQNSRLACRIELTGEMDGMVLQIPPED
jgi:ferredoxin, 2Fe-2S